ncbi:MAG TPA: hypothetical protein VGC65_00800 [Bacteroidia bacterium]|jgi:hypothetical protein
MDIKHKKAGKSSVVRIFWAFIFLILFSCSTGSSLIAQEKTDSITDSSAIVTEESSDGPSIKNLSKNLSAGNEEIARLKEKARRDQIIQYIIMVLGFAVVIGIAWFTTALAKKRKKKEDEQRAARAANTKHKPHHPHHPRR